MMRGALLILLAGCAATPARVVTDVQTQVVRVKVPVPCEVVVPKRPESVMPKPGADITQNASGALADVRALRDEGQYLDQLENALRSCTQAGTPSP